MDLQAGGDLAVDRGQELQELLVAGARPFFIAGDAGVQSSASVWDFSSMHSTTAFSGRFRYRPPPPPSLSPSSRWRSPSSVVARRSPRRRAGRQQRSPGGHELDRAAHQPPRPRLSQPLLAALPDHPHLRARPRPSTHLNARRGRRSACKEGASSERAAPTCCAGGPMQPSLLTPSPPSAERARTPLSRPGRPTALPTRIGRAMLL